MSFESARFEFQPVDDPRFTYDIRRNPNVVEGLRQLIYIPGRELVRPANQQTATIEHAEFSLMHVVSSLRAMRSWAGEDAPKKHLEGGDAIDSLEYAVQLAVSGDYLRATRPVIIRPFRDNAGKLWGAVADGTHRVMAAKIKGDATIIADLEWPLEGEPMMQYDGVVADFLSQ